MAYVVPALICFIYLKGYYDTFSNRSLPVLIGWMCFAVILLVLIFWAAFSKSKKIWKILLTNRKFGYIINLA